MDSTSYLPSDRSEHRPWPFRALPFRALPFRASLGVALASALVTVPAIAQASPRPATSAAATCAKVSTGSVAKAIGHSVPAPTSSSFNLKPTRQNDGISAVETSCTFGAETSLAALKKDVVLVVEVTSRSLTANELKKFISQAEKSKVKITSYSGLGVPAFFYSFNEEGINARGITGVSGTKVFGAFVFNKEVTMSRLVALTKLSENL